MSEKQSTFESRPVLTYEVEDGEHLSEGVVSAVSAAADTDPSAMEPLAKSIDPDALDALFADQYDGTARGTGVARFDFFDYELVVRADGLVTVLDTA